MPIYEYACRSCEHRFETIQRASEEPLRDCPECGDATLKKLLSAPVFRLKGSGWYETDFKSGDKRNVADSGRPDKSNGEDKGKEKPNSDTDGVKAPKASEAKSETGNAGSKGKPAQEAGGTKASSTGKATNGKSSKSSD